MISTKMIVHSVNDDNFISFLESLSDVIREERTILRSLLLKVADPFESSVENHTHTHTHTQSQRAKTDT